MHLTTLTESQSSAEVDEINLHVSWCVCVCGALWGCGAREAYRSVFWAHFYCVTKPRPKLVLLRCNSLGSWHFSISSLSLRRAHWVGGFTCLLGLWHYDATCWVRNLSPSPPFPCMAPYEELVEFVVSTLLVQFVILTCDSWVRDL